MKVTNRILLTFGSLLMSAAALPAQVMKADIPFDFYVGNEKLTAGEYRLTRTPENSLFHYRIQSVAKGESTILKMPIPVATSLPYLHESKLIFRCAQGECEMAQIWSAAGGYKVGVGPSKRFRGVNTEVAEVNVSFGQ